MRKNRVLVFTRQEIFYKFATFVSEALDVELADTAEFGRYREQLAGFDLIFLRTKDRDLLAELSEIVDPGYSEGMELPPILDTPRAVEFSLDRWRVLRAAGDAGVSVPEQLLPGEPADWPVIAKNRIDRGDNEPIRLSPHEWATGLHSYAQRFLESDWEYKVYMFGKRFWFFRQRPTFFYPDKLATREAIEPVVELKEYTGKAADAAGLRVVSADFLYNAGVYYLTDLNPTPGLQNLPGGYGAIVPELLRMMRK